MSMTEQGQSLNPLAVIELIEVDLAGLGGASLFMTNDASGGVVFNGTAYTPLPIKISGIANTSEGAPTQPRFDIGVLDPLIMASLVAHEYWRGSVVTLKKCFSDQLNIVGGESFDHRQFSIDRGVIDNKTAKFVMIGGIDFIKKGPARYFSKAPNTVALTVARH